MENYSETNKFPPGWDCKYDQNTGKCYYINYLTKAMSLEDPRIKYRQLQNERVSNESIPMQPVHGSPYHVYPTSSYPPAVQAFQTPIGFNVNNHNNSMTSSPLLVTKLQQQMEMSPVFRNGSPHSARIISQLAATSKQNVQETSFITPAETDATVSKINSMFPTASESHIRLLLKKYYNREAVVISALQVEKHPLTTPGPFSTPPPPIRHNSTFGMNSFVTMTPPMGGRFEQISSTGSPIPRPASATASAGSYGSPRVGGDAYRSSPKPHSSPKMKLRYLKSIFPKAEETLLLDILANADNNVQKASEQLQSMGYEKRDTTAPRLTNRQREAEVMRQQIEAENTPPPQPKLKTTEDKKKVKAQLQNLYRDIPGRIITMALDSVDYSEEKAVQILQIVMQQEDGKSNVNQIGDQTSANNATISSSTLTQNTGIPGSKSVQSIKNDSNTPAPPQPQPPSSSSSSSSSAHNSKQIKNVTQQDNNYTLESTSNTTDRELFGTISKKSNRNRLKTKTESLKTSPTSDDSVNNPGTPKNKNSEFKSVFERIQIGGANPELYNGPNDDVLLVDYIAWSGANPDLCIGQKGLALGPDKSIRNGRTTIAHGPNKDLYQGAKVGLSKGSLYSQIKCN